MTFSCAKTFSLHLFITSCTFIRLSAVIIVHCEFPHAWMSIWAASPVRKGQILLMLYGRNSQAQATAVMFAKSDSLSSRATLRFLGSHSHLGIVSGDGQMLAWASFPPEGTQAQSCPGAGHASSDACQMVGNNKSSRVSSAQHW